MKLREKYLGEAYQYQATLNEIFASRNREDEPTLVPEECRLVPPLLYPASLAPTISAWLENLALNPKLNDTWRERLNDLRGDYDKMTARLSEHPGINKDRAAFYPLVYSLMDYVNPDTMWFEAKCDGEDVFTLDFARWFHYPGPIAFMFKFGTLSEGGIEPYRVLLAEQQIRSEIDMRLRGLRAYKNSGDDITNEDVLYLISGNIGHLRERELNVVPCESWIIPPDDVGEYASIMERAGVSISQDKPSEDIQKMIKCMQFKARKEKHKGLVPFTVPSSMEWIAPYLTHPWTILAVAISLMRHEESLHFDLFVGLFKGCWGGSFPLPGEAYEAMRQTARINDVGYTIVCKRLSEILAYKKKSLGAEWDGHDGHANLVAMGHILDDSEPVLLNPGPKKSPSAPPDRRERSSASSVTKGNSQDTKKKKKKKDKAKDVVAEPPEDEATGGKREKRRRREEDGVEVEAERPVKKKKKKKKVKEEVQEAAPPAAEDAEAPGEEAEAPEDEAEEPGNEGAAAAADAEAAAAAEAGDVAGEPSEPPPAEAADEGRRGGAEQAPSADDQARVPQGSIGSTGGSAQSYSHGGHMDVGIETLIKGYGLKRERARLILTQFDGRACDNGFLYQCTRYSELAGGSPMRATLQYNLAEALGIAHTNAEIMQIASLVTECFRQGAIGDLYDRCRELVPVGDEWNAPEPAAAPPGPGQQPVGYPAQGQPSQVGWAAQRGRQSYAYPDNQDWSQQGGRYANTGPSYPMRQGAGGWSGDITQNPWGEEGFTAEAYQSGNIYQGQDRYGGYDDQWENGKGRGRGRGRGAGY